MVDSEAVEQTLAVVRSSLGAPADARARVRAGLVAEGAFDTAAALARRGAVSASAGAVGVAKTTTAVLVALGVLAGYWLGVRHEVGPAPSPSESTRGVFAAPVIESAAAPRAAIDGPVVGSLVTGGAVTSSPVVPEPLPEPPAPSIVTLAPAAASGAPARSHAAAPRPRATIERLAAPADPFADELALLQRAERAIRADQADLALTFLDDLDRRYPASTLAEERSAARLLARCALHEPQARTRAELFLRDRPTSVYSDRLRRLCEIEVAPEPAPGNDKAR